MMPRKIIGSRKPSRPATCERTVGNWLVGQHCGEPLHIVVTASPMSGLPYRELIVLRCAAGHVLRGDGVLIDA